MRVRAETAAVLATALLAGFAAADGVPKGYLSTRDLAKTLKLERKALGFQGEKPPSVVRLSGRGRRVTLLANVDYASVDGQAWELTGKVVAGADDLYVPASLKYRLAPLVGVKLASKEPVKAKRRTAQVVVLDAGHGGKDPGAIGRRMKLKEKVVALDVARRVAGLLKAKGVKVVMTRAGDQYPSLAQRVKTANAHNPDLFVSIHADSAKNTKAHGSTAFFPDDRIGGGRGDITYRALKLRDDHAVDPAEVGAPGRLSEPVEGAVFGLLLQEYRAESRDAAGRILKELGKRARTLKRGIRPECYYVVRYPRCPSVLVELDFLSNREAEKRLADPAYRAKLAKSVAEGILSYLKAAKARRGGGT